MNQQVNNNNQPVLPRRSRRLATIIPASNWISMGYSEDDAQSMEKLQNDMKKYCDNSGNDYIDLRGREDVGELSHHDMMLPHWKKLFKALQGRTNVGFHITGISLPTSLLDIAFPALQLVNIVELTLFGCGLGGEGFQCLSSFLENNSSLTSIGFGADQLGLDDLSVATALSDAVENHPTLEEVFIGDCAFHVSGFEKILEGCTTKKRLTLTLVDFNSDGIGVMADFIRSNHPLEKLHLRDTNLTDNDAKLLALALKTNTRLKELVLRENNEITEEGEKSLLKAMFDQTSMDSIVESNHVCKAYAKDHYEGLLFSGFGLNRERCVSRLCYYLEREALFINGLNISIQNKIRKKVVLALCGLDGGLFDLSHFNDLPLGVMPRVLELIQKHATTRMTIRFSNNQLAMEKDALSRLFHTLRGWELPLLFVNLNTPSANVTTGKRKRRKTRR